jgi:hypothetical protein
MYTTTAGKNLEARKGGKNRYITNSFITIETRKSIEQQVEMVFKAVACQTGSTFLKSAEV